MRRTDSAESFRAPTSLPGNDSSLAGREWSRNTPGMTALCFVHGERAFPVYDISRRLLDVDRSTDYQKYYEQDSLGPDQKELLSSGALEPGF